MTHSPFGALTPNARCAAVSWPGWAGAGVHQADPSPASRLPSGTTVPFHARPPGFRWQIRRRHSRLCVEPRRCSHRDPRGAVFVLCRRRRGLAPWDPARDRGAESHRPRTGQEWGVRPCLAGRAPGRPRLGVRCGPAHGGFPPRFLSRGCPRDQAPDIQRAGRDRPETRPDLARAPLSGRKQQSVCDPRAGGREDPPRRAWAPLARGRQWHVWPKRELWTGAGPEEVGIAGRRGTAPRCGPLLCLPRRWTVLWGTGGGASSQAHDRGALPSPRVLATLAPGAALRPLARWGRGYPSPFLPLRKQRPQFPARRPSHPRPACAAGCALPGCSRVLGPRAGLPSPQPAACAALQGSRGAGWGAAVGFGRDQGELGAPRVQGDGGPFSRSPGRRRPGALPGSAVPPALRLSGLRP